MRQFDQLFAEAGVFAWVHLGLMAFGLLWAFVAAILVALRWKVPPVVGTLPLALTPLTILVGTQWSFSTVEAAVSMADRMQRAEFMAAGIAEALMQGLAAGFVIPAALLLGVGGFAAGIRAPRAWLAPVGILLLTGFTALLPLVGLAFHDFALPQMVSMAFFILGVIPMALSTANAHPAKNGPEAGTTAAAAWLAVVGSFQVIHVASGWVKGFAALANVGPEHRATLMAAAREEFGSASTLSWVILAFAGIPLLVSVFRPGPTLTDDELLGEAGQASPWRSLGRGLVLVHWLLWAGALWSVDAGGLLERVLTAR
jgi:hypothetical protein